MQIESNKPKPSTPHMGIIPKMPWRVASKQPLPDGILTFWCVVGASALRRKGKIFRWPVWTTVLGAFAQILLALPVALFLALLLVAYLPITHRYPGLATIVDPLHIDMLENPCVLILNPSKMSSSFISWCFQTRRCLGTVLQKLTPTWRMNEVLPSKVYRARWFLWQSSPLLGGSYSDTTPVRLLLGIPTPIRLKNK